MGPRTCQEAKAIKISVWPLIRSWILRDNDVHFGWLRTQKGSLRGSSLEDVLIDQRRRKSGQEPTGPHCIYMTFVFEQATKTRVTPNFEVIN